VLIQGAQLAPRAAAGTTQTASSVPFASPPCVDAYRSEEHPSSARAIGDTRELASSCGEHGARGSLVCMAIFTFSLRSAPEACAAAEGSTVTQPIIWPRAAAVMPRASRGNAATMSADGAAYFHDAPGHRPLTYARCAVLKVQQLSRGDDSDDGSGGVWMPKPVDAQAFAVGELIGHCRYLEHSVAASADCLDVVDEHVAELIHRDYRAPLKITSVDSDAICRRAHCIEYSPHVGLIERARRFEPELGTDTLHEAAKLTFAFQIALQ
jgi:hypothetical protein